MASAFVWMAVLVAWTVAGLGPALADSEKTVTGRATVIDGDTLRIGTSKIRLHGIDAPEKRQKCQDMNGNEWQCGARAT